MSYLQPVPSFVPLNHRIRVETKKKPSKEVFFSNNFISSGSRTRVILVPTVPLDQKQIDKNIADIKQNMNEQKSISIGNVISGIAINIIFIFVLALIFGALFKKDEPVFTTQN